MILGKGTVQNQKKIPTSVMFIFGSPLILVKFLISKC